MLRLFLLLFTIGIVSLGAGWLLDHDGILRITWQNWQITTTVSYALLLLGILFVLSATPFYVLIVLRRLPKRLKTRHEIRRHTKALDALTQAWIAGAEGDTRRLKHSTAKARKYLGDIPPVLLLALELARQEGNRKRTQTALDKLERHPQTRFIALKGALEQAKAENHSDDALALAREARRLRPDLSYAARELLHLLKQQERYDEALVLLEKEAEKWFPRARTLEKNTLNRERALLYLMRSRTADQAGEHEKALESSAEAFSLLPSFPPIALQYSRLLRQTGKKRKASGILKKIQKTWQNSAWTCTRCGHSEQAWDFFCSYCNATDTLTPKPGGAAVSLPAP